MFLSSSEPNACFSIENCKSNGLFRTVLGCDLKIGRYRVDIGRYIIILVDTELMKVYEYSKSISFFYLGQNDLSQRLFFKDRISSYQSYGQFSSDRWLLCHKMLSQICKT